MSQASSMPTTRLDLTTETEVISARPWISWKLLPSFALGELATECSKQARPGPLPLTADHFGTPMKTGIVPVVVAELSSHIH